jgi:hypothetical protein
LRKKALRTVKSTQGFFTQRVVPKGIDCEARGKRESQAKQAHWFDFALCGGGVFHRYSDPQGDGTQHPQFGELNRLVVTNQQ